MMSVLDLQRRMRQLGEIRIGHVVDTGRTSQKTGRPITRPEKLDKFRITSPSRDILERIAEAYGGQVRPWTPANGGPDEFEVFTETNRIPVVIPPLAVTQWYELYQGSKCVRRCDGQTEQKSDRSCLCDPEQRDCALTTRLNVMLRDIPPVGYWLLTSRGYYAATELPPVAELLAQGGGHVPGWLGIEERREMHEKPDGSPETRRFMVPTLDIDIAPAEILAGGGRQAIGANSAQALGGAPKALETGSAPDYLAEAKAATSLAQVQAIWKRAYEAGHLDEELKAELTRIGDALNGKPAKQPPDPGGEPDADAVWQQILAVAGEKSISIPEIEDDFAQRNGGLTTATASGAELAVYLEHLRGVA